MFTDMVGYTALGQRNESLSLALVEEQRKLIRPVLAKHNGREVKTIGDAFLVDFASGLDAVRCAYDIQRATREFNFSLPEDRRIRLRIGIHLGDVVEAGGDVSGDAVNIASRIESLAKDGGVTLTRQVYDQVQNKFEIPLKSLGPKQLKNVSQPLEVYRMVMPWEGTEGAAELAYDTSNIAVLPFVNMSPDPNDSYFADGMTEEIISVLSNVSGLKVISRTSAMSYKGTPKKLKEIGRELEVGSVLEGSFRKAGNKIRVTTQLITVNNDKHVWAQNYDRKLDDVFAVQSDIARQVAETLRVKILAPEMDRLDKKPTTSTDAYVSYLRGRHHWNKRDADELEKAAEYFEQAVERDRDFALGYVGLADSYELLSVNWGISAAENHKRAKTALAKALGLDKDLAEAHATNGLVLMDDFDFQAAEEEFKRAIELKPSYATAHQWYFHVLVGQSRFEEAGEEIKRATELDPLSIPINDNLATYYDLTRDFARALEISKKTLELNPGSPFLHFILAVRYASIGMREEADREKGLAVRLGRDSIPAIENAAEAFVAHLLGDKEMVRRVLPELVKQYGSPLMPRATIIAGHYFWLGDDPKGFEWLERAYADKESALMYLRNDRMFDGVRADPRFIAIYRRIGLSGGSLVP
jgi:TolB-like protein/Tfp pilus assembly protein PilF